MEIAKEYRERARGLPQNGLQDIGERRKLRKELQKRYGLPELAAINIINGYYLHDYVMIEQQKQHQKWR